MAGKVVSLQLATVAARKGGVDAIAEESRACNRPLMIATFRHILFRAVS